MKDNLEIKTLVVVEGFFDLFHLRQTAEASNVVALMGSHASLYQLGLLSEAKKLVLIMDGDEAGRKGDEQIASALKDKTELHSIQLPDGKEPEHLMRSEMKVIAQP